MGASEALPAFAQQMGEVQRADRQEQRAIEQMNFAMADAQRKERMGDARGAQAAVETARKFRQDANRAKGDKLRYQADIAARTVGYSKVTGKGAGAGAGPKLNELAYQANVDNLKETTKPKPGESDTAFDARIRAMAADLTTRQTKTTFSTSEIAPEKANVARLPVQEKIDAAVSNGIAKFKVLDGGYRKAKRTGDTAEAERLLNEERIRIRKDFQASEAGAGGGSSRSTNPKIIKLD
jgi:response regulator of citrate/malate metabolism